MSPIMNNMPLFVAHSEWLAPEAYSSPGLNYLCLSVHAPHILRYASFSLPTRRRKKKSVVWKHATYFWGALKHLFLSYVACLCFVVSQQTSCILWSRLKRIIAINFTHFCPPLVLSLIPYIPHPSSLTSLIPHPLHPLHPLHPSSLTSLTCQQIVSNNKNKCTL